MTEDIIVRRLSIIKHLYKLGIEQSILPETISYTSILSLHDSIDMFMNLAAEKRGVTKGQYLMQYFDSIPELTLKSSVDKINKRRNSLKHHGIIPGKVEIQDTCSVTKVFLEENTKVLFGKDFNNISLYDLVSFEIVKKYLNNAVTYFEAKDFLSSAKEIAKAYYELMNKERDFTKTVTKHREALALQRPSLSLTRKPLSFSISGLSNHLKGIIDPEEFEEDSKGQVNISQGLAASILSYNNNFNRLFESINILSLGADYRKYTYFEMFMPVVVAYNDETNELIASESRYPDLLTEKNLSFAFDFVLDLALKIQEFKY